VRHDPFYHRFELQHGFARPAREPLIALLRLGVPMGGSILIEVTGFTFMAFFISRIGAGAVAAHHVAVNVVSLMFMMSLAIANASSTLVAQRVGAGDIADARRIDWHGVEIGTAVAALLGASVFLLREPILRVYTGDAAVIAAALPLLAWVALFHVADAAQTVAAFVLRAWRIATVPMLVYVLALWGIGLGGGYGLAFVWADTPALLRGAQCYWAASTAGLTVAALVLAGYLGAMLRRQRRLHAA
jgi:MATE family multidrug resistance protein